VSIYGDAAVSTIRARLHTTASGGSRISSSRMCGSILMAAGN
jgi:hypothetical protein